jgi:hypothetical protein
MVPLNHNPQQHNNIYIHNLCMQFNKRRSHHHLQAFRNEEHNLELTKMLYHPQIHLEYALLHLKLHIFYISKLGGEGSSKSSKNIIG